MGDPKAGRLMELTDDEILVLLNHDDQSLVTAVERILATRKAAAEHRGAVNALREAADTAERLRADTYLARVYRDRADRIEAGDA